MTIHKYYLFNDTADFLHNKIYLQQKNQTD